MKTIIPSTLIVLTAIALSQASLTAAEKEDKKPTTRTQSTSTSTQVISRDGKAVGTVTVTVNNDGKVETKTWKIGDTLIQQPRTIRVTPLQKMEKATWLGVAITDVSEDVATQLPLPKGAGLRVRHVEKGSPADKAGLKADDLIYRIDEQIIFTIEQFQALIRTYKPGSDVDVTFFRKGKQQKAKAKLETHELLASNPAKPGLKKADPAIQWRPNQPTIRSVDPDRKEMSELLKKLRDAQQKLGGAQQQFGFTTQRRAIIVNPDGKTTVIQNSEIQKNIRESVRKSLETAGVSKQTLEETLEAIDKGFGGQKKSGN